jgi:hypothetical protein
VPDHIVQTVGAAHGGVQAQALDTLPVLLQQGNQEVGTHMCGCKPCVLSMCICRKRILLDAINGKGVKKWEKWWQEASPAC